MKIEFVYFYGLYNLDVDDNVGHSLSADLNISQQVSFAIADIIQRLNCSPKFIIAKGGAKGGITSSDIATKELHIKKARVIGQAAPGIPVWQTGEEAKFPNIPYIVFPGNVGNRETLKELILKLT